MAKEFPDLTGDGKVTQADVLKGRGVFAEGSLMVPVEMEAAPVDTYNNLSPEEEKIELVPDTEM